MPSHLSTGDETTPCSRCHRHLVDPTLIFDHDLHVASVVDGEELKGVFPRNHSCTECHGVGQPRTPESAKPCLECHREDTRWAEEYDDT
jgi:DnaJ-class molecular chaperone